MIKPPKPSRIKDLEAYEENTSDPNKPLTMKQQLYVDAIANQGLSKRAALRVAGYRKEGDHSGAPSADPEKSANVKAAIMKLKKANESSVMMTKKRVMEGFLEAIEMAKIKGDPFVMISGWREVAKMCGYYEPIKHKIEIDAKGQIIVQKLQTLTDAQLLQLAQGENDGNIIDGEIINESNARQQNDANEGDSSEGTGET
jgi:hypothetical protein